MAEKFEIRRDSPLAPDVAPLLQRHLPAIWCSAIDRLVGHSPVWAWPMVKWLGLWVVRIAQQRAEVQARQRRRMVLESDEWMNKALPFGD